MGIQVSWHFCHKCFGMFYNGDQRGLKGICPAGGGHEAYGFNFVLQHTDVPQNFQGSWRFCQKCFGMFYGGDSQGRKGRCPVNRDGSSSHWEYGLKFALRFDAGEVHGEQPDWRFCHKCFGLFYGGDPAGRRGRCPTGRTHEEYGFNFSLPHSAIFVDAPDEHGAPSIAVRYDRAGPTFTVTGENFLPSHAVHVRVVNHAHVLNPVFFQASSDSNGRINIPISFAISFPQTYGFSANDERRNSQDLTGTLWSNTVTLTAT